MPKKSTIIKIDLRGFDNLAQTQAPQGTPEYLNNYYQQVFGLLYDRNWRMVKCIGDCVIASAQ